MLDQCWTSVSDAGPTLIQRRIRASYPGRLPAQGVHHSVQLLREERMNNGAEGGRGAYYHEWGHHVHWSAGSSSLELVL